MGRYAEKLRAILSPILDMEELVLTWFRSTETMMRSCEILPDIASAIIMPFLIKSRALVTNRADDRVLTFEEIHELRLAELKLTLEEYKRRFQTCRAKERRVGANLSLS